jgi:hypothetical protein
VCLPYPRKVKDVDYDTMYRLYVVEKKSSGEIARMYGVTTQPVLDRLEELGIPRRSSTEYHALRSHKDVNEHFFSKWTPEMAYVLGWVLSDGHIDERTGNLRIVVTDEEVLHKIANVMKLTNGIRPVKYKGGKQQYVLSVCRRQIYEDLISLGVKPGNRVFDQPAIDVPHEYRRHFVRGFFDGDGSLVSFVAKKKGKTPYRYNEIVFSKASKDLIDCLHDMIVEETGVYVSRCAAKTNSGNITYRLSIGAKDSVITMYRWMYEGVENRLWLERKYEKFVSEFGPLGKESDAE